MKSILVIILFSSIFISCNNSESSFSQEFKDNFLSECVKSARVNLSNSEAERYCNCVIGIVMTKYGSDSEADKKLLNMSMNDMMELVSPCQ